jgi:hypothetical protein
MINGNFNIDNILTVSHQFVMNYIISFRNDWQFHFRKIVYENVFLITKILIFRLCFIFES